MLIALPTSASLRVMIALAVLLPFTFVNSGCRDKAQPTEPIPQPPTGEWTIQLRTPQAFYRNEVGGYVENDTIVVRVYNPEGEIANGISIRTRALVSQDSITMASTSIADTLQDWWGCEPAIIYWGSGGADGRESVESWIMVQGDTAAITMISFKVLDPL